MRRVRPDAVVYLVPLVDGGEGRPGRWPPRHGGRLLPRIAAGPLGDPVGTPLRAARPLLARGRDGGRRGPLPGGRRPARPGSPPRPTGWAN
ncbi:hypothetical protein [Streptomyces hydrogenans]|uniref:hypothetical protein n=1 Tax=Streptomyces hydrogenans TaxID=1873719 RepID=UPI0035591EB8